MNSPDGGGAMTLPSLRWPFLAIVLPAETDMGLVEIEQAAVGDCDAMGIAPPR